MKSNDEKKPESLDLEGDDLDVDASLQADAEEREEAARLRDALAGGSDAMGSLLAAALRPGELDEEIHEQILAKALGGAQARTDVAARPAASAALSEEAPASAAETRAAGELRDALEARKTDHPLVGVAHALRHAHAPRPIDDIRNEALLRPALKLSSFAARRRVAVVAVFGALAVAAGFLGLYISQPAMFGVAPPAPAAMVAPPGDVFLPGMVEVRSTNDLFQPEDFPATGGATDRIDRISQARQADLRQNRFAAWGLP
ncbi:MAG: hypothetical protein JNK04_24600 [Myxococcales bacterium]|nr:hypothetical protein [Myxococcales bacterium]